MSGKVLEQAHFPLTISPQHQSGDAHAEGCLLMLFLSPLYVFCSSLKCSSHLHVVQCIC